MTSIVKTVCFQGVDVKEIDVQVQIANGLPAFNIVGLPDKAIAESKERIRAALHSIGLSLPSKRVTVNLAPADVLKEGSHFDLPIALGILSSMGTFPVEELSYYNILGELGLDGSIRAVSGVLPAAINSCANNLGIICPEACGSEAVWAGDLDVLAPNSLISLLNHIKGLQVLSRPEAKLSEENISRLDFAEVKGQESAKRAIEIAAAGGHNLLMIGPPGSGKSMLASRMTGILPPMLPHEALETSMIHSIAGTLAEGKLITNRPFRDPHHSASLPAIIGGGHKARPGEISLAHNGILFLDELPEFSRQTLEALRQPLETKSALVSRVNYHVKFPAKFQLIAAMNPCKCGYADDPAQACGKAPKCVLEYQSRISGPVFDRIDIHIDVPAVSPYDLSSTSYRENSATIALRIDRARSIQNERLKALNAPENILTNSDTDGDLLMRIANMDDLAQSALNSVAEKMKLSARGYHRVIRVARTIADLSGSDSIKKQHIMEAAGYRRIRPQTN